MGKKPQLFSVFKQYYATCAQTKQQFLVDKSHQTRMLALFVNGHSARVYLTEVFWSVLVVEIRPSYNKHRMCKSVVEINCKHITDITDIQNVHINLFMSVFVILRIDRNVSALKRLNLRQASFFLETLDSDLRFSIDS